MAEQSVSLKLDADASGLKSEVESSGQAMDDLAGRSTQAGDEIEQSVSGASSAWQDHSEIINGAAVAVGAMGAAVEGLARSQQDTRAVAGRLAGALEGETTDSVMGLAAEIHDATTDLDNLVASMEAGSQQGLRSAEELQEFAQFWDMVGDATGESDAALAEASVALRAVGVAAGEESQALGAFGFITRETTQDVGDFLQFLERTGPELNELGASVDDAAALLGIMEDQFGMSGRVARQEFRSAINESDGTLEGLLDTLGVSEGQFEEFTGRVAASSGVIEENAEAYGETRTRLQELTASFESFMAEHSGMVEGLSALSPVMMGAGGAVFAFNQLSSVVGPIAGKLGSLAQNASGAQSPLRGLGRAAGIAGIVWAADEAVSALNSTLIEAMHGPVQGVEEMTLALEGLAARGEVPDSVAGSFDNLGDAFDRVDVSGVTGALMGLQEQAARIPGIELFSPNLARDVEGWQRAEETIANFDSALAQAVASGNDEALEEGLSALSDATGLTGDELERLAAEHLPEYSRAVDAAGVRSGEAGSHLDDLRVDFSDLRGAIDDTTASHEDYIDSVRAAEDPVFRLDRAVQGVEKAEREYQEALEEHGPWSDEAADASLNLMSALSEVEAAAIDGDLSFDEFDHRLQTWVDQGKITAEQAQVVRDRVGELTGAAEEYSSRDYNADVTADVDQAMSEFERVEAIIGRIPRNITTTHTTHLREVTTPGSTVRARAEGGPVWPGEPFLVGEEGPELVTFSERGTVHDAQSTSQALQAPQTSFRDQTIYRFERAPDPEEWHQVRKHESRRAATEAAFG